MRFVSCLGLAPGLGRTGAMRAIGNRSGGCPFSSKNTVTKFFSSTSPRRGSGPQASCRARFRRIRPPAAYRRNRLVPAARRPGRGPPARQRNPKTFGYISQTQTRTRSLHDRALPQARPVGTRSASFRSEPAHGNRLLALDAFFGRAAGQPRATVRDRRAASPRRIRKAMSRAGSDFGDGQSWRYHQLMSPTTLTTASPRRCRRTSD